MVTLEGVYSSDTATSAPILSRWMGRVAPALTPSSKAAPFPRQRAAPAPQAPVSLGPKGASYDVNFEARADGAKVTCSESIDG